MGKRRADADNRRFFDEFESVRVSRFRAMGVIDPAKREALIPFPNGKTKLIGTGHVRFPNGGGWSFFICPKCAKLAGKLYLIDDAPLCVRCCGAMNIKHSSKYGFGRETRRIASDKRLDQLIAKLETTERLTLKPAPPSWQGRAQLVTDSRKLTQRMRRSMISLRLGQLAKDHAMKGERLKDCTPFAATKQLINLKPIWRARTAETLQRALDKAQLTILAALESEDPWQRLNAAKLMMRTKQARERGLGRG